MDEIEFDKQDSINNLKNIFGRYRGSEIVKIVSSPTYTEETISILCHPGPSFIENFKKLNPLISYDDNRGRLLVPVSVFNSEIYDLLLGMFFKAWQNELETVTPTIARV